MRLLELVYGGCPILLLLFFGHSKYYGMLFRETTICLHIHKTSTYAGDLLKWACTHCLTSSFWPSSTFQVAEIDVLGGLQE